MDTQTRGTVLVTAAVALLVLTLGVSAAVAPETSVSGADDSDARQTIVGIQGGGPGWHKYGSVAAVNGTDVVWRAADADSYFDVTQLDNGHVMAAFMDSGYEECGPYESPCTHTGFRIIDPSGDQPEVVSEYSFPVNRESNSEVHDVEKVGENSYVMTDMVEERLLIVENDEVVWEWHANELYEAPPDVTKRDWLHINDVDVIAEDTFLVSVRNANQLVVVERGEGVVEVINADDGSDDASCKKPGQLRDEDGDDDVRCGNPELLDHQHNPQWLGGDPAGDGEAAVLVADSDNDRVVELHRVDGEWEIAWKLESTGDVNLRWPRDADRLDNGNTLITDTLNKRVLEVSPNGSVVWSIRTERIPYEADRVPQGEQPEGTWYGMATPGAGGDATRIPVLGRVASLLRGVFPWLPFWYGGVQVGLTLVAFGLAAAGGRDLWRTRSLA